MQLGSLDLIILGLYAVGLFGLALWVSREPAGQKKNTEDYFCPFDCCGVLPSNIPKARCLHDAAIP